MPAAQGVTLAVSGDGIGAFRVYLQAPKTDQREIPFSFVVRETESGETARYNAIFRGSRS